MSLFSKDTQALLYNYKDVPIQSMLDFDYVSRRVKASIAGTSIFALDPRCAFAPRHFEPFLLLWSHSSGDSDNYLIVSLQFCRFDQARSLPSLTTQGFLWP